MSVIVFTCVCHCLHLCLSLSSPLSVTVFTCVCHCLHLCLSLSSPVSVIVFTFVCHCLHLCLVHWFQFSLVSSCPPVSFCVFRFLFCVQSLACHYPLSAWGKIWKYTLCSTMPRYSPAFGSFPTSRRDTHTHTVIIPAFIVGWYKLCLKWVWHGDTVPKRQK